MQFFEGGNDVPNKGSRTYAASFAQNSARRIYCEVSFTSSHDFTLAKTLKLTLKYYKPDGSLMGVPSVDIKSYENHSNIWLGWGWQDPGHWPSGTYSVEAYLDGGYIGKSAFDIYGSTSMSSAAGEKARDGRFIAYDNGTALDTRTNLIWAAKDNGYDITWQGAKSYCENYRGGGYTNWRMPTQDELAGLYDANQSRPAACNRDLDIHVATEFMDITCYNQCASETRGSDVAGFDFCFGKRAWVPQSVGDGVRVLPVRSGK
jgi:hypothetical protein